MSSCFAYCQQEMRCDETCVDWPDCALRPAQNYPEYCYYKKRRRKTLHSKRSKFFKPFSSKSEPSMSTSGEQTYKTSNKKGEPQQ